MYYENAFKATFFNNYNPDGDNVKISAQQTRGGAGAHSKDMTDTGVSAINTVRNILLPLLCLAAGADAMGAIRVNQLGFPPQAEKLAVITATAATSFEVVAADTGKTVFRNQLGAPALWKPSDETVRLADFSALTAPGEYRLKVNGEPLSDRFTIRADAYRDLNAASIKAYYLNRAGIPLLAQYAGVYARPAGHMDDKVLVHASAASPATAGRHRHRQPQRLVRRRRLQQIHRQLGHLDLHPAGRLRALPRLLQQAEPGNIPESGNGMPDILNEALWNLDWMLTMQDPNDGGVYHKLTNKTFDGMVMPDQAMRAPRYVVQKSTAAALDFAATMATASRVFKAYDTAAPGLSARMLAAAEAAWKWAEANPALTFRNPGRRAHRRIRRPAKRRRIRLGGGGAVHQHRQGHYYRDEAGTDGSHHAGLERRPRPGLDVAGPSSRAQHRWPTAS
jgi:endoglucanase